MRMSSLNNLVSCPGLWVLRATEARDVGGPAAQTGSAVGRAIELYHGGHDVEDAVSQVLETEASQWPRCDEAKVLKWSTDYAADPRNPRGAVVEGSCEQEVVLDLEPAPEDPTGSKIRLVGHLDQLRRDPSGLLRVWDVKSGGRSGRDMIFLYAWQLAAYAAGVTQTLGEPCWPGGIIRLRGYDARAATCPADAPVTWETPWDSAKVALMLATVRQHVAWLRLGLVHLHPGSHCAYCPAGDLSCADPGFTFPSFTI